MDDESIDIVIVMTNGVPTVACSINAHVHIADENGFVFADFPAQDLKESAAKGLAALMAPKRSETVIQNSPKTQARLDEIIGNFSECRGSWWQWIRESWKTPA